MTKVKFKVGKKDSELVQKLLKLIKTSQSRPKEK